jgi:type IX secretion system PorP/SprF family membrane protein
MTMKRAKNAFLLICLMLISSMSSAQDPHFSQFFSNPLALNPAFTGSAGCSRITSSFRDQWPNISGTYISSSISYDQYVEPMRSSLGFRYIYDNAGKGTLQTHMADLTYAFPIKIKEDMVITPAVNVGMGLKTLDWEKLTFPDQISHDHGFVFDTTTAPGNLNKYNFNIGMGLLFSRKNLVIGLAADHLNQPDVGFLSTSRMPIKFAFHASYQFNIKEIASITPTLIFLQQSMFEQIAPALLARIWYIKLGAATRFSIHNMDCVIGMIGFQNKWMSIGYSYDYTVSKLTNNTGGAHEISAMFKFNCKNKTGLFNIPSINGF